MVRVNMSELQQKVEMGRVELSSYEPILLVTSAFTIHQSIFTSLLNTTQRSMSHIYDKCVNLGPFPGLARFLAEHEFIQESVVSTSITFRPMFHCHKIRSLPKNRSTAHKYKCSGSAPRSPTSEISPLQQSCTRHKPLA